MRLRVAGRLRFGRAVVFASFRDLRVVGEILRGLAGGGRAHVAARIFGAELGGGRRFVVVVQAVEQLPAGAATGVHATAARPLLARREGRDVLAVLFGFLTEFFARIQIFAARDLRDESIVRFQSLRGLTADLTNARLRVAGRATQGRRVHALFALRHDFGDRASRRRGTATRAAVFAILLLMGFADDAFRAGQTREIRRTTDLLQGLLDAHGNARAPRGTSNQKCQGRDKTSHSHILPDGGALERALCAGVFRNETLRSPKVEPRRLWWARNFVRLSCP